MISSEQDRMVDDTNSNEQQQKQQDVDENLYSRQLYVLGVEAMKRMQKSDILIVGLGGLGVEIAKNAILSGVKSVTLHDQKKCTYFDLSSQFYLTEKSIGQNRAEASLYQLKELNQYVPVKVHKDNLTEEFIRNFSVVVFTDNHISELVEWNGICRKHNIKFIATENRGLAGSIFCDFGNDFIVHDQDGENPVSNIVTDITNDKEATVSVHDDKPTHGLHEGDAVKFEGIEGMEEINHIDRPIFVKPTGRHTFKIDLDTTNFHSYKEASGGYVTQVKVPKKFNYQSLREQLDNPSCIEFDFAKMGRPQQVHVAMLALRQFQSKYNRLPKPFNQEDAQQLITLAKETTPSALQEQIDEDLIRKLSYTSQGNLSPICALLGGMAAQEALKACSGKFTPLNQWFHYEAFECLPEDENQYPTEQDCTPENTRYDGQVVTFGKSFQRKLLDNNQFIVGAGALGCEYLKNYAMMGVACGNNGRITVTDMDNIEVSNLNRQFLFRRKHVGQQKSTVAAEAVQEMNPNLNVLSMQDKVAPETEDIFDDEFWENLHGVTNALDNVQARLYVDGRCVFFRKPLLESGTLGTKGNVQTIIPFLTETYGSTRDPPEQEIPICTLKNFPNQISHCIQWARDVFEGEFNKTPSDVNAYLSKSDYLNEIQSQGGSKKTALKSIHESLVDFKPVSFDHCVEWARHKFEELYSNNIKQLLYNFPPDMITSSGTPFWGGPKRPPTPIQFDPNDETHIDFIVAAANLRAQVYGLKGYSKHEYDFRSVLDKIHVPEFTPKSNVKIATTDQEERERQESEDDDSETRELESKIPKPSQLAGYRLNPVEFEKDDDTNYHIDFVTAASNLRARNYKIPEADKHKTKGIAGKIIPAMVTTTALVTGLTSLELYKIMQNAKKLETYKNCYVNVALPFVTHSEPGEPAKSQYKLKDVGNKEWTIWDRFDIDEGRDITLGEFMQIFEEKFGLVINMMSSGKSMVYSFFGNKKKNEEKKKTKLSELVKQISKQDFLPSQKYLTFEIVCEDAEEGEEQDVPSIRYKFRGFDH